MKIELPALPYATNALEPHISAETLEFHHGKHHATYVKKVQDALAASGQTVSSLEELVKTSSGGLFNNAAQSYNHALYWESLSPKGGGDPSGALAEAIHSAFGSADGFRKAFTEKALGHFGSGWVWLVLGRDGKLAIEDSHDAECPLRHGKAPLMVCDVWEHAYYIDRRNNRGAYVEAFWKLVDWSKTAQRYEAAAKTVNA